MKLIVLADYHPAITSIFPHTNILRGPEGPVASPEIIGAQRETPTPKIREKLYIPVYVENTKSIDRATVRSV
jgi:hypothetical protein